MIEKNNPESVNQESDMILYVGEDQDIVRSFEDSGTSNIIQFRNTYSANDWLDQNSPPKFARLPHDNHRYNYTKTIRA